jgi:hypothetical protein
MKSNGYDECPLLSRFSKCLGYRGIFKVFVLNTKIYDIEKNQQLLQILWREHDKNINECVNSNFF